MYGIVHITLHKISMLIGLIKIAYFLQGVKKNRKIPLSHLADIFHHRYSINVGKWNKGNNWIVQGMLLVQ